MQKVGTKDWLHARLAAVASEIVGVDNSEVIPESGLPTAVGWIRRGSIHTLDRELMPDVQVIVLGELIEHLPDALSALTHVRETFPGADVVVTTPNATGLTNVLLAPWR